MLRFHRHRWVQHPLFTSLPVRRCDVCGRVEHRGFLAGGWVRAGDHLQPKLTGWFRLPPFGLFLEVSRTHREV